MIARENDHIEFKTSFQRYKDEKLLKFVQGVANKKGGHILFGINENKQYQGEILGLEANNIKNFGAIANR